ncbi:hypothetical protein [Ottowia oryzae]|uniref:hypothetical protein n=1 Tax=Ottowia oryzae TaxID=2109914 RepID=UPI000F4FCD23|nr:hypothetical protein [Ottowia oryzae]
MDTAFIDLDILLSRVRSPQSRAYLADAVKAYKAGALRGALTSAWVALVYDLIVKYRELSALGDGAASAFLQSWDNATSTGDIPKLLQLEAEILNDATANTQVVNRLARSHLERLREDRHLCAHPAFSAEAELFEPTSELVRLHLVNAIDLVLSQEPLQGKAIFDIYDLDVLSQGFPSKHERILEYVEQRYIVHVRSQNIRNFGTVLAKSLLKGVPDRWDAVDHKISSSLVAIRDRAPNHWSDIKLSIVQLLDRLEPPFRPRAIAFIAVFPDFWGLLQQSTQIALRETAENSGELTELDYRILTGVTLPQFRTSLLSLIEGLSDIQLREAVAIAPLSDLWSKALEKYKESGSWRSSERNFSDFISPFAGKLDDEKLEQVCEAIMSNGQNWDAADTDTLLLALFRNTPPKDLPSAGARDRLYRNIHRVRRVEKYEKVVTFLQSDGWSPPPIEAPEAEE